MQECDDSFFVCDLGDVVQKYKLWTDLLPRVKPFYGLYWLHYICLMGALWISIGHFKSSSQVLNSIIIWNSFIKLLFNVLQSRTYNLFIYLFIMAY